jgi:hypothetical protein
VAAWIEFEFEVSREVAQGTGFDFWKQRSTVSAKSLAANMFSPHPGGWLTAKGTPNGLRAIAAEAFVSLFELLRLEREISRHQGKPIVLVDRDLSSSFWYPVAVALGNDYDRDGEYAPDEYAFSADDEIVALLYGASVIVSTNTDTVEVHTFGGYDEDERADEQAGQRKAQEFFDTLVGQYGLEQQDEGDWSSRYTLSAAEQQMIDRAVAAASSSQTTP